MRHGVIVCRGVRVQRGRPRVGLSLKQCDQHACTSHRQRRKYDWGAARGNGMNGNLTSSSLLARLLAFFLTCALDPLTMS